MTSQIDDYFGGYSQSGPQKQKNRSFAVIAAAGICLVTVVIAAVSIISAVNKTKSLGTLSITTTDSSAEITLLQASAEPIPLGKGNLQKKLKAGSYTAVATSGDKKTFKTVSVEANMTTTADLDLVELQKIDKLADYNARDVSAQDDKLFFLNTDARVPYVMRVGDRAAKPFATPLYPVNEVSWVNKDAFYVQTGSQQWALANSSGEAKPFQGQDSPLNATSMYVNRQGGHAYITPDYNVMLGTAVDAKERKIASVDGSGYRLAVSADNSVLIYPDATTATRKAPQVISNGKATALTGELANMLYAEWAPTGKKFSYSTPTGIFLYDSATNRQVRIFSGVTTNSLSLSWLDADNLAFAQDHAVWKYSVSAATTVKLAGFEGELPSRHPFAMSSDNPSVYFGTIKDGSGKGGAIYRLIPGYSSLSPGQKQSLDAKVPSASDASYVDFDKLADYGLTSDQINNARYYVSQLITAKYPHAGKVSVITNTVQSVGSDPAFQTLTFAITVDNSRLGARLDYAGVSRVHIVLNDPQGNKLLDAGSVQ